MRCLYSVWGGICLFLVSIHGTQAQTLVLNDTNGAPYTTLAHDGFLDVVVSKAFAMVGVQLELVRTPAERGLLNANEGIDDGELTRIKGIDKVYTNLIRVPEKVVNWDFVAFSKNPNIQIKDWQSLKPYNIGHIRGWKILEINTAGFPYVETVRNSDVLFTMLEKDRIDIALFSRWIGMAILKKKKLRGIHVLEPPLASREMYIYLNKKHAELVPKIADALRQIKQSGEYERLFREKVINSVSQ